jgi:hypothetical protein
MMSLPCWATGCRLKTSARSSSRTTTAHGNDSE